MAACTPPSAEIQARESGRHGWESWHQRPVTAGVLQHRGTSFLRSEPAPIQTGLPWNEILPPEISEYLQKATLIGETTPINGGPPARSLSASNRMRLQPYIHTRRKVVASF